MIGYLVSNVITMRTMDAVANIRLDAAVKTPMNIAAVAVDFVVVVAVVVNIVVLVVVLDAEVEVAARDHRLLLRSGSG